MTDHLPVINGSISGQAIRGTFWNYLSFASGKLLNFITTIILARLLVPEEFGLVGYCTIAIQYLDIMNTAGIDDALIARKNKMDEATNAAFVINIGTGLLSFGLAWIFAPSIANFFQAEKVTDLFRVLAIVLPVSGMGLVPDTLIKRKLRFRDKLKPDVSSTFAKGFVSITMALLGYGAWSLVWGQIAGTLVRTIVCWSLVDWRPTWVFNLQVTTGLIQYGSHIVLIGFAGALNDNVDYIIVGRILGATALGFYTMAYRLPELAIRSFNYVVSGVMFPLLSRLHSDNNSLQTYFSQYLRYITLFTFSTGTGLALTAGLFVNNFLSSKWAPAALPMMLLSIALAVDSVRFAPGVIYKSINKPEILTMVTLIRLPLVIGLLIYSARWGINGIALGQVILAVISVIVEGFVLNQIIKAKLSLFVKALLPASISSLFMALVVGSIIYYFTPSGWIGFILLIGIGILAFVASLTITSRDTTSALISLIRNELINPWFDRRIKNEN